MTPHTPPHLSADETKRYARHLVLKDFGGAGQQALKGASIAIIGAGGLGSPAIAYLAAAGIGRLGIFDADSVSLSNLQRQIVHNTARIGINKAESAGRFALSLNEHVALELFAEMLTAETAQRFLTPYDIVLDGTDNLATRRAVADACEILQKPLVSGAVSSFSGQLTVFAPHLGGPRHSDFFADEANDDTLPSCEANGILGPVTGVIGTLMAMEAIKLVSGVGTSLIGRLMLYDAKDARFTEIAL
ncbi:MULTISPECIES: HesA/MoeB/ThiF family protein [unclassified Devosia]|uniref:HesA/MoeB/ThiF family protein n=1 Tax=unclassified Devosia TaxID=196773 RepID=UPI00145E03F7|nr:MULTISPECIES: HesA/MoeB/ThiF family protein [unclassified Devosia]MBJ6987176.1 HesA/MoeB/ThiF family protein [Devosia sp. MC521]QMW62790.1 HesA/MoeB/ThiF family protein [Devosia sp. MC521]